MTTKSIEAGFTTAGVPQPDAKNNKDVGLREVPMAYGFLVLGTARGAVVMSNVFLSTALIFLASKEVGCTRMVDGEEEVIDNCQERVYGVFLPSALVTDLAAISGFCSALFMPVAGAIVDFTSHRWTVGVVVSTLIVLVQVAQIFTNSQTWFAMAILQAVAGCLYQVLTLASYAYLPDIARQVPGETMARFTSFFSMAQFSCQTAFLVLVVALAFALETDDVTTAQMSQATNAVIIMLPFTLGWRGLPRVGPRNTLEEGKSLVWQGFAQNWKTAKKINRDYRKSLKWFLWGVMFAESAANAFTVVAVVYLNDTLKLTGTEIGAFFFVVLIGMVPGGLISMAISRRSNANANTTMRICLLLLFVLTVIGALTMTPKNAFPVSYIWGFCVGLTLGTYYPSLKLFLSLVTPKSQEAEIVGFYVYCTQLLVWLPPMIFSWLVEANVDQNIGMIVVSSFFLVAIALFSMAAPFDELLEEVRFNDKHNVSADQRAVVELERNQKGTMS